MSYGLNLVWEGPEGTIQDFGGPIKGYTPNLIRLGRPFRSIGLLQNLLLAPLRQGCFVRHAQALATKGYVTGVGGGGAATKWDLVPQPYVCRWQGILGVPTKASAKVQ